MRVTISCRYALFRLVLSRLVLSFYVSHVKVEEEEEEEEEEIYCA